MIAVGKLGDEQDYPMTVGGGAITDRKYIHRYTIDQQPGKLLEPASTRPDHKRFKSNQVTQPKMAQTTFDFKQDTQVLSPELKKRDSTEGNENSLSP